MYRSFAEFTSRSMCSVSRKTAVPRVVSYARIPSKTPEPQWSPCVPTWTVASAQSTSSPFIQIFEVSCMSGLPSCVRAPHRMVPAPRPSLLCEVRGLGAAQPRNVERRESRHVPRRSRADPHRRRAQQLAVDERSSDARRGKRRHRARVEPGRRAHLLESGCSRVARAGGYGDLPGVGALVARHENEHRPPVADEDERLDDLRGRAADGTRGCGSRRRPVSELLEPCVDSALAQDGGDTLDGLGPVVHRRERNHGGGCLVVTVGDVRRETKVDDRVKRARTEALFRDVNERIAESAQRFDAESTQFVCECADPNCTHRLEATLDEYEDVRADGATFMLAPGHEHRDIERIIADRGRFHIVEKVQATVRATVERLNPRANPA